MHINRLIILTEDGTLHEVVVDTEFTADQIYEIDDGGYEIDLPQEVTDVLLNSGINLNELVEFTFITVDKE